MVAASVMQMRIERSLASRPLLAITNLRKEFPARGDGRVLVAVNDVSLELRRGETLGLVGESGSGKTTLARMIVGLEKPTAGQILLDEEDLTRASIAGRRDYRRRVQMVFQNPAASLNPHMKIGTAIARPLLIHKLATRATVKAHVVELLAMVGLRENFAGRYPHQVSGGQQQRVGIARALSLNPELTILDEPTSALDVSVQAQLLRLLRGLQCERRLTFLFISHDLSVVGYLSNRIAVMFGGRMMEIGSTNVVITAPRHPYTRRLIAAVPRFYGVGVSAPPTPPHAAAEQDGCPFFGQCPQRLDRCRGEFPSMRALAEDHGIACFNPVTKD